MAGVAAGQVAVDNQMPRVRTNGTLDVRDGKDFRASWFDDEVVFKETQDCEDAPVKVKVYTFKGRPALLARRTDGKSGPVTFTVKGVEFADGNEITGFKRVRDN